MCLCSNKISVVRGVDFKEHMSLPVPYGHHFSPVIDLISNQYTHTCKFHMHQECRDTCSLPAGENVPLFKCMKRKRKSPSLIFQPMNFEHALC